MKAYRNCNGSESYLAPSARSNPTAFEAVRFQRPVPIFDNGMDGGVQA